MAFTVVSIYVGSIVSLIDARSSSGSQEKNKEEKGNCFQVSITSMHIGVVHTIGITPELQLCRERPHTTSAARGDLAPTTIRRLPY